MRLIVCGLEKSWLLDTESESWRCIVEQPSGYTYGATWDDKYFYMSSSLGSGPRLLTLDQNFNIIQCEETNFGRNPAPHQLHYNQLDGKIYWCMAQRNNGVVMYRDPAGGEWEEWNPCEEPAEDFYLRTEYERRKKRPLVIHSKIVKRRETPDPRWRWSHYINSVWFDDSNNGYVMSMNRGPSELVICNGRERKDRLRCGRACHNVWKEGDSIYYFDSVPGHARQLGKDTPLLSTNYFPRGVAFDGEHRYIGMSFKSAKKADRERMNSHITITDASWNVERIIDCPFKGEIYDIRALAVDYCHNRLEPPCRA